MYLGGAICEDCNSDTNIRRRMTARANAWRKVEELTGRIRQYAQHKEGSGNTHSIKKNQAIRTA